VGKAGQWGEEGSVWTWLGQNEGSVWTWLGQYEGSVWTWLLFGPFEINLCCFRCKSVHCESQMAKLPFISQAHISGIEYFSKMRD
jgi:hypothetical protein